MRPTAPRFLCLALLASLACSTSDGVVSPPDGGGVDAGPDAPELPPDADTIPCEPRAVLQTVCQQCHTNPPAQGAPFPLVNRSDVLAMRPDGVVRELMIQQLEANRMPLPPVTIDDGQRQTLLDWLEDGAPGVPPQACPSEGASSSGDAGDASDE